MADNAMEVQIVPNDDRLRRKLGVSAAMPLKLDAARLAEAEKAIAQMEGSYRDWLETDLKSVGAAIERIAADPKNALPHIKVARGLLHDIRGQGGTFDYGLITAIADSLHDLLRASETPDARLIDLMRIHMDALRVVQLKGLKGDGGEEGRAMRQMLALAVAKLT